LFLGAGALVAGLALAPGLKAHANGPAPATFTPAQAAHGQQLYLDNCASCHGPDLNDGGYAPSLKGQVFRGKWTDKSVGELYGFVAANMPPGQAGDMPPEDYAAVVAFLMQSNGADAGSGPLASDTNVLSAEAWPAPKPAS
jgi:mono/diheme cytochrome c family protein